MNKLGEIGAQTGFLLRFVVLFLISFQAQASELSFHFYGPQPMVLVPENVRSQYSTSNCLHLLARLTRSGSGETQSVYRTLSRDTDLYREVLGHLEFVNRRFLEDSPYAPETIEEFHRRERSFPLQNTTYLVVTDPNSAAVATARIFDPNVKPSFSRLPLEEHLDGGNFVLPRRELYEMRGVPFRAIELGRYAVVPGISEAARSLLKGVAANLIFRYIEADNTDYRISPNPETLWVYMQTREELVSRMERLGFRIVAGPFQEKKGNPKEYVLEMSARDLFDNYFYQTGFTVVPERRGSTSD